MVGDERSVEEEPVADAVDEAAVGGDEGQAGRRRKDLLTGRRIMTGGEKRLTGMSSMRWKGEHVCRYGD